MIIIFLLTILFFLPSSVKAGNNLIITCNSSSCLKSTELSFFDENNIAPGFSKTQSLTVINERPDACNLQFKLNRSSVPNPLSALQMLSIYQQDALITAGTFNDFSNNKYESLGNIDSYQFKEYLWTTSLNQSLGNNYKLLSHSFNLDLNFFCGAKGDSGSICKENPPSKSPQNLKAIPGRNSVTLSWEETDDIFSYYLISYSTEKHAATFATANIGGRGTTSYTLNNLIAGLPYYFKIRTGNFCAPGPFSEIVSTIPLDQSILKNNYSKSFPKILGVKSISSSVPSKSLNPKASRCFNIFPYTFLLAFLLNFIFLRYYLFSFIVSLLSFVADYYLNKHLCRNYHYFYINNLLSFLLPLIFSLKKPKT